MIESSIDLPFPRLEASELPKALQQGVSSVEPLMGGLTNRSWRIRRDVGDCIWRPHSALLPSIGIERAFEKATLDFLKPYAFAPNVVYFGKEGIANQWIDGVPLVKAMDHLSMIEVMALYHQLPISDELRQSIPSFDYHDKMQTYWHSIPEGLRTADLEKVYRLSTEAPEGLFDSEIECLLHCDLGFYNLVQTTDGIAIIDWEYACIGDPMIDVVLTSMACRYRLDGFADVYCHCFGLDFEEQRDRVNHLRFYCELMSTLWYVVCYTHNGNSSYLDEAQGMAARLSD